jgi:hypothetical protein
MGPGSAARGLYFKPAKDWAPLELGMVILVARGRGVAVPTANFGGRSFSRAIEKCESGGFSR